MCLSLARPSPRGPNALPQREHAITDRKEGVGRGGEGRARRAQDPTGALGGRHKGGRGTLGHERSKFWELFQEGSDLCVRIRGS